MQSMSHMPQRARLYSNEFVLVTVNVSRCTVDTCSLIINWNYQHKITIMLVYHIANTYTSLFCHLTSLPLCIETPCFSNIQNFRHTVIFKLRTSAPEKYALIISFEHFRYSFTKSMDQVFVKNGHFHLLHFLFFFHFTHTYVQSTDQLLLKMGISNILNTSETLKYVPQI